MLSGTESVGDVHMHVRGPKLVIAPGLFYTYPVGSQSPPLPTWRAMTRRCRVSMSSGTLSSCTRIPEHASSTRSMALSGRKRSVM